MFETENQERREQAILCAVNTGAYDVESSLDELSELADTAGADTVAKVIQTRPTPDGSLFLGIGKLDDIKEFYQHQVVDVLIFDDELSPSQQRNIEEYTGFKVIDRTTLILDIFAQRARSKEGKLQVELAQLKYMLPRLSGKGTSLSRLGGGIGTRGPGESKLESDKRHIRRRIDAISEELKEVEKRRGNARKRRAKDGIQTVAIVGYTNAGKSTLMNRLTEAGVLAEDKLFATLDPTSRALTLPSGRSVMLIDTVGLVRRLPHNLVEAFKSTLEEAAVADLILNVCDASSKEFPEHLRVTKDLLHDLGAENKPMITVMNKCDRLYKPEDIATTERSVFISALHGDGIKKLLTEIDAALPPDRKRCTYLFPYSDMSHSAEVRADGTVFFEEYTETGLKIDALCSIIVVNRLIKYVTDTQSNPQDDLQTD